jgi:hypothetical protein
MGISRVCGTANSSYPQHIHNLKTLEFEALTTTYCARIHRARRQRGGFARRLVEAGLKAKSKA